MIITPLVSWIWFAVLMMGLGGIVALIPARPVVATMKQQSEAPADAATPISA
jgi:cytochrome c biogenesis factor